MIGLPATNYAGRRIKLRPHCNTRRSTLWISKAEFDLAVNKTSMFAHYFFVRTDSDCFERGKTMAKAAKKAKKVAKKPAKKSAKKKR